MIVQFHVGGFDDNFSYLIISENEAVVVDPAGDLSELVNYIEGNALTLTGVLITHSHFDHIEGVPEIEKRYSVPVYIHKNGVPRISAPKIKAMKEGDTINVGDLSVDVLHTPGHIDDAVCFSVKEGEHDSLPALITGDTLFVEGCGRTTRDNAKDLYESLGRLKKFDPKTNVYTGHDYGSIPVSTIAHELQNNRFFLAEDFKGFLNERFPS